VTAAYITSQKKTLTETPAVEEYEPQIPSLIGPTARIPPEMMPSETEALRYFDYYFTNIHPYVPVINRSVFYQQWQNDRDSMSPLLLEAVFACVTLLILGDAPQGDKWLALASSKFGFESIDRTC
jgi:hypothetical protein